MKKKYALSLVAILSVILLSGCSSSDYGDDSGESTVSTPAPANTDPKAGWVSVGHDGDPKSGSATYIDKKCDGTTLMYATEPVNTDNGGAGGSVSVVANSPECIN